MKMTKFIIFIVGIVVMGGCASCKNALVKKISESYVATAHKNENSVNVGMSSHEVISVWGEPQNQYKLELKNETNFYADEIWKYLITSTSSQDIYNEIYFQSGKAIKIKVIKMIKISVMNCGGAYLGL